MDAYAPPRRMRGDILFGPLFTLGIIAAIAIPAYVDYTIRSQVAEGLNLAAGVKAGVAEFYAATGTWPADLKLAGLTGAPRGRYVTSVTVRNGTVVIRYGGEANARIAGHQLTLRPTTSERGDVTWSCGYSPDLGLDPRKGAAAAHATNMPPRYLPSACRG